MTFARFKQFIKEDGGTAGVGAPTNNVSGGAIAGVGVGSQGEPGIRKKKHGMFTRKVGLKAKQPKKFMLP